MNNEAIIEFISECEELSQRVTRNLAVLEGGQQEKSIIDELYRDMHTIKGNAQLFGFEQMGQIAHVMETSLDPVRQQDVKVSPEMIDALYSCLDVLAEILDLIKTNQSEPNLKAQLQSVIPRLILVSNALFSGQSQPFSDETVLILQKDFNLDLPFSIPKKTGDFEVAPSEAAAPANLLPLKKVIPPKLEDKVSEQSAGLRRNQTNPEHKKVIDTAANTQEATGTIRVHVGLLDSLMNLAGEMVLVRNQVKQYSSSTDDMGFLQLSQKLDLVTTELQSEVMKTRMQPIGNVLETFQRVVRDLAKDLGKKISLELEGKETELDKTLLEAIKDPLTHIVRNSADHGIELPAVRADAGKTERGTIRIKAFHEGGQVIVDIIDDGKGLNRDAIMERAVERGLVPADAADSMSDREIYNFIFAPGFSTAQTVTTVSGRGVGMDVVKTNIEKIGGVVELTSTPGHGTVTRLKIPLTLAIVPALIFCSGHEKFAIPQTKLVELVRVDKEQKESAVEYLQGKPMYRLRGELLPLIELSEILKLNGEPSSNLKERDLINIVVLNADGNQFGLVVDEIFDTADIVVKPLSQFLKFLNVYSGATIMGDGTVALIIDVIGITQWANLFSGDTKSMSKDQAEQNTQLIDLQEFLLCKVAAKGRYAVPLVMVNRLEEFFAKNLEFSGSKPCIRYRGSILPLISLNQELGFSKDFEYGNIASGEDLEDVTIPVIVVSKSGRNFGIIVDQILDVIESREDIDSSISDRKGILGNVIVNEEVVVVTDIHTIIDQVSQNLGFGVSEQAKTRVAENRHTRRSKKILVVEDSGFYRRFMVQFLENAGFTVDQAENGRIGYRKVVEDRGQYDLILSDIEMPEMTGWEMAEAIRKAEGINQPPLVAVTTRFSKEDQEKGISSGFDQYLEKLKKEEVLVVLDSLLKIGA